ncbi:tyrosine-type recombinase/integrase [Rubrivirga sp.]|uniref:tyrosine-type recombinase/integrase n=1 Tax=Rubrivirga sp. TaxID=1885344 RepID=UPI003B51971B
MSKANSYRAELPDGTRAERSYRVVDGKKVPRGNWQWVVYDPDRRPTRKRVLTKRLQTLAERARVNKTVTAYALRHAYGTRMAAAGVPLLDLARLMGTSLRMIERHYGHYDPARGASHVDRVFGEGAETSFTLPSET